MNQQVLTPRFVELSNSAGKPKMLVAIDTRVADYHHLARGIQAGSEVLLLDPRQDGIRQISQALGKVRDWTSLHLISHGEPGCLYIGNTVLKLDNLHHYTADLQQWHQGFRDSVFELLLYGCEVAQGIGQQFIERLSQLTQARIAASRTRTGNASKGGDWQLEVQTGQIFSPLALRPEIMAAYEGVFTVFNPTNITQLIADINAANDEVANPGQDIINLTAGATYSFTSGQQILAGPSNIARGFAALPKIFTSIIINGNGAIIERSAAAATNFRLMYIDGEPNFAGNLTLNNVTLQGGRAEQIPAPEDSSDDGGAIWNSGIVTINNAIIQNNTATDDGGAIANFGQMTISNSTIQNNNALGTTSSSGQGDGGAIDNRASIGLNPTLGATAGLLTINNTTISGNTAVQGGAIVNQTNGARVVLNGSTITNNTATGGAIPPLTVNSGGIVSKDNSIVDPDGTTTIENNTPNNGIAVAPGATINAPDINLLAPDGTPIPISGAFNFGQLAAGTTLAFTVSNTGNESLLLSNLSLPTGLRLLGTFPSTVAPSATAQLQLQVVPDFQGAITGSIQFNTNDYDERNYTFSVSGNAVAAGGGGGVGQLTVDGNNVFTITAGNLKYVLSGTNTNLINEIGLFKVDGANGAIGNLLPGSANYLNTALQNSQVLFSALRSGDRPNEFTANQQNGILDLENGDRFAFYIIRGGTKEAVQAGLPPGGQVLLGLPGGSLRVRDLGSGRFALGFEDGGDSSFSDVVVQIEATADNVPLGVGSAQLQGQEVLDFRASAFPQFNTVGQVNSNFRVYREAAFNNLGGLYRVDDPQGTIDGLAPGQAGYAQAALGRRIETLILSVSNQSVRVIPGLLEGNALYAPFLIANASVEEFLAQNPNNLPGGGPQMYFPYIEANPDNVDHFRLLGNNVFGAEDIFGGGDFDYNDLIIQGNFVPA